MPGKPRLLVLNQYYWPGLEATAHLLRERYPEAYRFILREADACKRAEVPVFGYEVDHVRGQCFAVLGHLELDDASRVQPAGKTGREPRRDVLHDQDGHGKTTG